jgi:hypothetical protein
MPSSTTPTATTINHTHQLQQPPPLHNMANTHSSGTKTHSKMQMKPAMPKLASSSTHKHAMSQVDDDCMAKKQCKGAKTGVKGGEEEKKGEKKERKKGSAR